MRERKIIVEPFELLDIISCEGKIGADCHGYMEISGYIHADREMEYQQYLLSEQWVEVNVCDEDGRRDTLFTGIVTAGEIGVENGVKTLSIMIKTGSYLMDLKEHIRTFQDSSETYRSLLETITSDYANTGFIMNKASGKTIGDFLCQYHETDWQFARRLASYCNTWLYPNEIGKGVKFYFGLPLGEDKGAINSTEYKLCQKNGKVIYKVRLREIFRIGDKVRFQNQILCVLFRETSWEHSELCHTYELGIREKKQDFPIYNEKLIGVSLMAVVTGVKGTEVTLSIGEDENKVSNGGRWFSYATVYSSPDGSGWYCMPEVADGVRLYFPSVEEKNAYVFSSVHLISKDAGKRCNPDYKSIMNKQGKEILLKPDSILVTNNAGMSLELSDSKGISIISNKEIVVKSQEAIELISETGKIDITAAERISLYQGDTKLELSDRMTMQGAKVRLN